MPQCGQEGQPMTENINEEYATRTLHTRDLLSGEELVIAYFPKAGVVTINGYSVTRSSYHEELEGRAVFHREMDEKLFTVDVDSLSKLFV